MTLEMQEMLEREMDDALAIEDGSRRSDAVQTVSLHYLRALTDCQRKTAERVKEMMAERDAARHRLQAVNWIGRAVAGFSAAGGFVFLVKMLRAGGLL